jgi:transposase
MGNPLSMDLRERLIAAVDGGMSTRQAASRFSVGIATAGSWARLKRAKGSVRPARQGKPKGSVLDPHADFVRELIDTTPDITLQEIAERLAQERSIKVVYTAVWKFLNRHGLTHKKRLAMPANKSATT